MRIKNKYVKMQEFILNNLDLNETIKRLDTSKYGMDEILMPTLNAADALQIPDGFTHACLDRRIQNDYITR